MPAALYLLIIRMLAAGVAVEGAEPRRNWACYKFLSYSICIDIMVSLAGQALVELPDIELMDDGKAGLTESAQGVRGEERMVKMCGKCRQIRPAVRGFLKPS